MEVGLQVVAYPRLGARLVSGKTADNAGFVHAPLRFFKEIPALAGVPVVDHAAVDIGSGAAQFDGAVQPPAPGVGIAAFNAYLGKPLNASAAVPIVFENGKYVIVRAAKKGVDAVLLGRMKNLVNALGRVVVEHFSIALGTLVRKAGKWVAADAESGDVGGADGAQTHDVAP